MIAAFTLEQALGSYHLLLVLVLFFLLVSLSLYGRHRSWKVQKLALKRCEKCGLVFAVDRFHPVEKPVVCPRCHTQIKKHQRQEVK